MGDFDAAGFQNGPQRRGGDALPNEDTTPPVTKTNLVMERQAAGKPNDSRKAPPDPNCLDYFRKTPPAFMLPFSQNRPRSRPSRPAGTVMNLIPPRPLPAAALAGLVFALAACQTQPSKTPDSFTPVEINIAHINDHHSNLEPTPISELAIDGVPTRVEAGGFRASPPCSRPTAACPTSSQVHAGDAMTGTLPHALYRRSRCRPDEHRVLRRLRTGQPRIRRGRRRPQEIPRPPPAPARARPRCWPPTSPRPSAPGPRSTTDYLRPYVLKTIGDVTIGIVGIEVRGKTVNSSRPADHPFRRRNRHGATGDR